MPATLLLDRTAWDVCLDASRNWALATEPYAVVQDVASACRLWSREAWYNNANGGIRYRESLGRFQPLNVLKAQLVAAAMTVPGVANARVFLTELRADRSIGGQVQVTLVGGESLTVTI